MAAAAAVALAMGIAACSSSSSSSSSGSAGATTSPGSSAAAVVATYPGVTEDAALHNTVPAKYRTSGVNVAVFNDWPPDEFLQNSQLTGWSVDLAHAMAAVLNLKFTYIPTSFDAILPGIQNGRFDAGFASFGVTTQRLTVLSFIPEDSEGEGYAALASSHLNITALNQLCGRSVAVLTGAFDYEYLVGESKSVCASAGKPAITLRQYATQTAADLAVISGRVQLTAAGSVDLGYLVKQQSKMALSTLVVNPVYNCIGVRKGDPLGTVLANALQQLINDGVYQQIMSKWGVKGLVTKGLLATVSDPNPQ
ncbi:MAG: transporter substrate-binding domain-containing protein [Streptosporangiaceae bacterium]